MPARVWGVKFFGVGGGGLFSFEGVGVFWEGGKNLVDFGRVPVLVWECVPVLVWVFGHMPMDCTTPPRPLIEWKKGGREGSTLYAIGDRAAAIIIALHCLYLARLALLYRLRWRCWQCACGCHCLAGVARAGVLALLYRYPLSVYGPYHNRLGAWRIIGRLT